MKGILTAEREDPAIYIEDSKVKKNSLVCNGDLATLGTGHGKRVRKYLTSTTIVWELFPGRTG
jgi:hypothetical protein